MDKSIRSLIGLLRSQDPTLRLAAIRVVAALELSSKAVIEALADALESDDEALQVQALRALAQLGPADALQWVAPKILAAGAVRQEAARVLALAGVASVPPLRKLYAQADHHGKRAIATTLAGIGGVPSLQFLLRAIPAADLEFIKHLTACARQTIEALPPASRTGAARELRAFLRDKATLGNPHAVIAGLILLGGMSEPKAVEEARALLLQYLDRKQPEAVRRNAAVSLARLPVPAARAAALLRTLVPFLCEAEWVPVVQNVLPMLQKLDLQPAAAAELLPLLRRSPHPAVHEHVLERLRGHDKLPVIKEVLPLLASGHPRLRDAAEAALKTMPGAADPVLGAWMQTADTDVARRSDAILRTFVEPVRKKAAARAAVSLLERYEKGDARWQVFLNFVRNTDAPALQKLVDKRLAVLRKSTSPKRFEAMEKLLQLLWDQNLTAPAQRYDYGLLLLRRSRKDTGREARAADPALRVLGGLARHDGVKLAATLGKERALGAEELYYLGFHWSEGADDVRPLGRALLGLVVQKYPRHKLRKPAQHKIELLDRLNTAPPPPAPRSEAPR